MRFGYGQSEDPEHGLRTANMFVDWVGLGSFATSYDAAGAGSPRPDRVEKWGRQLPFATANQGDVGGQDTSRDVFRLGWFANGILACVLLVPAALSWGMFLDGVTYASISRNLAAGQGSFWKPYYTATMYPEFYEHPPLGFVLESLPFRLFGESYLVEKVFALSVFALAMLLVVLIWHAIASDKRYSWLPVFLCLITPRLLWACKANMLENMLSVFTLLAFYCFLKSALSQGRQSEVAWSILAGGALCAGLLTKGPVALFPLCSPIAIACLEDKRPVGWGFRAALIAGITIVAAIALVCLNPAAYHCMRHYTEGQVWASLSGQRTDGQHSGGRFYIIESFFKQVLPLLTIVGAMVWVSIKHRIDIRAALRKNLGMCRVCLVTGLAAVLPIVISLKQQSYYIVPALPFISLAAALAIAPLVSKAIEGGSLRKCIGTIGSMPRAMLCGIVVAIGCVLTLSATPKDAAILEMVKKLTPVFTKGEVVGISEDLSDKWELHAYFERFLHVSLDAGATSKKPVYYLTRAASFTARPFPDYQKELEFRASDYVLLKRNVQ